MILCKMVPWGHVDIKVRNDPQQIKSLVNQMWGYYIWIFYE